MATSMTISADTIVTRMERVRFSRVGDEVLAIDTEKGFLYALNESAGRIWDFMETPIAVGTLCAQLRREYAVDEPTCQLAVTGVLQSLYDAGLVGVLNAPATPSC